jgi:hypothetical protein
VESWPLLLGDAARAPVIRSIQEGLTTPKRIWRDAIATLNYAGRAELLGLLGC